MCPTIPVVSQFLPKDPCAPPSGYNSSSTNNKSSEWQSTTTHVQNAIYNSIRLKEVRDRSSVKDPPWLPTTNCRWSPTRWVSPPCCWSSHTTTSLSTLIPSLLPSKYKCHVFLCEVPWHFFVCQQASMNGHIYIYIYIYISNKHRAQCQEEEFLGEGVVQKINSQGRGWRRRRRRSRVKERTHVHERGITISLSVYSLLFLSSFPFSFSFSLLLLSYTYIESCFRCLLHM